MKNVYILLLVLFSITLHGQEYYYNGSEKIEVKLSDSSFILFEEPTSTIKSGFEKTEIFSKKGFSILENKKENFSMNEVLGQQKTQLSPAFLIDSNKDFKMFPSKTVRVKLRKGVGKEVLSDILRDDQIDRIEEKYGVFRIYIKDIANVLEIANKIYEAGIAEFSIPDFYIPKKLNQVDDPLYPLQFQLHNTGQVIDGIAGVNDIDCNAPEAWDIALGNNITVAVFDQGLEDHDDFEGRFVGGFTPVDNGNGEPEINNATHGMNSAGIIAASHNDIGIRGVAPGVDLLSVNIFAGGTTNGDIADGIQWAINNGADVLSNSWSFFNTPCNFTNIDIENAIQDAVNNGRDGDGSVVVFSAGNDGGCVNYPARNENVISVGAVDNRGNLFNYSSRGPELDLVAASGETGYVGNVRTLDRIDGAGRHTGDYEDSFGGTSASCPVVSGVAALVLSVNPNLTQQEVRDMLTSTAIDMGANGFDNNFGNGRVNAFAAVQLAQDISLLGPDEVCSNATFTLESGSADSWQVSSDLLLIGETGTTITVEPKYSSGSTGSITANLSSGIGVSKEVKINNPPLTGEDITVRDSYFNSLSGDGTMTSPYLICEGEEYVISMYSPKVHFLDYSTFPSGWTSYSYGVYEIAFTPNNISSFTTYSVLVDYTGACGSALHTIYFAKETYCAGGMYVVSPNPTSDNLNVEHKDSNKDMTTASSTGLKPNYVVYDFQSRPVKRGELKGQKTSLDVSALKKGIYILKIYGEGNVETHKIIIE